MLEQRTHRHGYVPAGRQDLVADLAVVVDVAMVNRRDEANIGRHQRVAIRELDREYKVAVDV